MRKKKQFHVVQIKFMIAVAAVLKCPSLRFHSSQKTAAYVLNYSDLCCHSIVFKFCF